MSKIIFKDLSVEHILNKRLKHSYISIKPNSGGFDIILKTPRVSQSFIDALLKEKESWIRKQLLKIKERKSLDLVFEDELLLFGEIYSIDSDEAHYLRNILNNIKVSDDKKIAKSYDKFYKKEADGYLSQRVEYFSKKMNLKYTQLKFRKMRSRWGSCSSKRIITLNTELMKIKKELIDYVVVHELAHLHHMNHSKAFHALVDFYIDDSKKVRKELKNIYLGVGVK